MGINEYIEHTLLKQDAKKEDFEKLYQEAIDYKFFGVCINPAYVKDAHEHLKNTNIKIVTVIGFPLGATTTATKVFEAKEAITNGADEIDMVINVSKLKDKDYEYVTNDIKQVKLASPNNNLKVIIETCLLTDEEKVRACLLAKKAGADFVKTSTGFSTGGATVHDIELMRKTVGPEMGVKASGGIRTHEDLLAMIKAGATRIGTSSGPKII